MAVIENSRGWKVSRNIVEKFWNTFPDTFPSKEAFNLVK